MYALPELYKAVLTQLRTIPELKWIEQDRGQYIKAFERNEAVLAPAAWVRIETTPAQYTQGRQYFECRITVSLVTSIITIPGQEYYEPYELLAKVHGKLQSQHFDRLCVPLARIEQEVDFEWNNQVYSYIVFRTNIDDNVVPVADETQQFTPESYEVQTYYNEDQTRTDIYLTEE